MNEDFQIGEEEIIAHLLGELSEEHDSQVLEALAQNPDLRKLESELADTMRLLMQSGKDPLPEISDNDWSMSPERRSKIFSEFEDKLKVSQSKSPEKSSINLLFWVPLGIAACAFLIVMSSDLGKSPNLETVAISKKQTNETISKKSESIVTSSNQLDPEAQLNQLLEQQALQGATERLVLRSSAEVTAMNKELNEPLSLKDAFAQRETPLVNSISPAISPVAKQENLTKRTRIHSTGGTEGIDSIVLNAEGVASKTNQSREIENIATPDGVENNLPNEDITMNLDNNFDSLAILNSAASLEFIKGRSEEEGSEIRNKTVKKRKVKNGLQLVEHSGAVNLFTPTGRALGKVKITGKSTSSIEFLRLHETRLGKSALLSGPDYQLRFTDKNSSIVILVGTLERLESDKETKINNDLSPYLLQIKEAWTLNEKEIRQPLNLSLPK